MERAEKSCDRRVWLLAGWFLLQEDIVTFVSWFYLRTYNNLRQLNFIYVVTAST